uniref:UBC core domain-containing protein n=1 Tax=Cannabis sativa TaxID=3483 RepID=A0A803PF94_CANSA
MTRMSGDVSELRIFKCAVTRVKPYICTMPLKMDEGWNQIQFNLADFTRRAYGTNYVETLRVQVHANCRLRRIYFSERMCSEEELPPEFKLYLPMQQQGLRVDLENMIRLFKVKEKQRELAENANGGAPVKKQSAGELRLHKDITELNLPKSCAIAFPSGKDDLMNFEVTIRPDEGYYLGGTFLFSFQVSPIYPHEAPKVKCKTKVYHPNIDLEGNVCLNILREDWKPVLNINTIIYGLYHLFTEPNYEDPLNHDAAAVLRDNPKMFESNVRRAMAGGYVGQTSFPRCM